MLLDWTLKIFATNFLAKVVQIFTKFLGYFENHNFLSKSCYDYFLDYFRNIWATLYFNVWLHCCIWEAWAHNRARYPLHHLSTQQQPIRPLNFSLVYLAMLTFVWLCALCDSWHEKDINLRCFFHLWRSEYSIFKPHEGVDDAARADLVEVPKAGVLLDDDVHLQPRERPQREAVFL